jgi:hypothetical protein
MDTNLNPVETTVDLQPTTLPDVLPTPLVEVPVTSNTDNAVGELVTEQFHLHGDIPSLDNLSDEQKSQLKELQKRMELYNRSRSGHREGDTHKFSDGVSYLVTKSGAYNRIGAPRKSRKATHRKEVASRRAGKS